MYPELFRINDFVISSFGVMVALAFLVAYWVASIEFKRKGLDERLLNNLLLVSMIGGIVGAKLFYVFENVPLGDLLANPFPYLFSRGGLTFYGGFLGAVFLVLLLSWKNRVSFWTIADALAPSIAIGHAIGRIGCFLVGDDYGTPSNLPWAMSFPKGLPPTTEKVHPTQIYEALYLGIVFLILWRLRKRERGGGWLFSVFLILSGVERFFIEFIRQTTPSPIPGLSIAQLVALLLVLFAVVRLCVIYNRNQSRASRV